MLCQLHPVTPKKLEDDTYSGWITPPPIDIVEQRVDGGTSILSVHQLRCYCNITTEFSCAKSRLSACVVMNKNRPSSGQVITALLVMMFCPGGIWCICGQWEVHIGRGGALYSLQQKHVT